MKEDNKLTKNMPFITQGKTNLKYILIVVILAVVVGGGILWCISEKETPPEIIPPTLLNCEDWYEKIENDFDKANFCEEDSDCKAIMLGGPYVKFGCYKFVNILTNEEDFLSKVEEYDKACAFAINKCALAPEAVCINNKCVKKDETADWNTYTHKITSFKYPQDWIVIFDSTVFGQPNGFSLHVMRAGDSGFVPDALYLSTYNDRSGMSVDYVPSINRTFTEENSLIQFSVNGTTIYAGCEFYTKGQSTLDICNKVVSTIRFLE